MILCKPPICSLVARLTLAVLVLVFGTKLSPAAPVPKTPRQVAKESDFIGKVRVVAVVCTGEEPFPNTQASSMTYQAWLQIVSAKKGKIKAGQTVLVNWQDVPKTVMGPWKVEYLPGEEVETHLKWNAAKKAYETTWFTAKGKPTKTADVKTLPSTVGEITFAKATGSKPKAK